MLNGELRRACRFSPLGGAPRKGPSGGSNQDHPVPRECTAKSEPSPDSVKTPDEHRKYLASSHTAPCEALPPGAFSSTHHARMTTSQWPPFKRNKSSFLVVPLLLALVP